VAKLFNTIRGSGWPNLNTRTNGVKSWPSATASGTEAWSLVQSFVNIALPGRS